MTDLDDYIAAMPADRQKAINDKAELLNQSIELGKISDFDVVEYLTDETLIIAYLNEVLAGGVPSEFIEALNDVAKAKGMNELAEKPRFDTMLKIIDGMGLQVTLTPKANHEPLAEA
jgi:DNA-binding phage protein